MAKKSCKTITRDNEDWIRLVEDDIFAIQVISDLIVKGVSSDKAVEVYVNSVEGDVTQLPRKLAKYAKCRGWLEGY
jgi:hypothetical protein